MGFGEAMEKIEPSCIAGGNVQWCSWHGTQAASSSKS